MIPTSYKLVQKETGKLIAIGQKVTNFRGEIVTVKSWSPPKHAGSSGRVICTQESGANASWYPNVIGAVFVENTNTDIAISNAKMRIEEARTFLHRLAKHLEENGMSGQAGNCTIQALRLQEAGISLAFVERER